MFVASLGVWLPRADAATLIDLDATSLPTGPLDTWSNTGTLPGDFVSAGDVVPEVTTVDGVSCVALTNSVGTAGAAGTQYSGPAVPAALGGRGARTVEAWIFDAEPDNYTNQTEKTVFSFGRRSNPRNFVLEHGVNTELGALSAATADQTSASNVGNGSGSLGWGGNQNIVEGRWTYIAATYDGLNLKVYSDGQLRNSRTAILDTATVAGNGTSNLVFRIGRQSFNNSGNVSGTGVFPFYVGKIVVTDTNLSDAEILANFNAQKATFSLGDADGDGLPDWWEMRNGLDPNDATGANGASGDPDTDGASNLEEYQAGSNPQVADTDGDGINDGAELHRTNPITSAAEPTDPTKADTDGDGLSDAVETGTGTYVSATDTGTNPTKADTDGDSYSDGFELAQGTDPFDAGSHSIPLINLDSSALAAGPLNTWTNTGSLTGNFIATGPTNPPNVELIDGVDAVHIRPIGGGTNAQQYLGPETPDAVTGSHARTVDAWVRDDVAQDELAVLDWGSRGGASPDGNNWSFGMGMNGGDALGSGYGAVALWGAPDIGWRNREVRGRWVHIAATYDGATTRVYMDGELVNSEDVSINTMAFAQVSGADSTLTTNRLHFRMARQNTPTGGIDATGSGDYMIAKVRVFDVALDAGSIKAAFDEGKSTFGLMDTDGDGMPDWYEARCGLDKNSNDAAGDKDGDGLTNLQEYQLGTRADVADTDGDGVSDSAEADRIDPQTSTAAATNPLNDDTDGDSLKDNVETDTGTFVSITDTGTDPLKSDTDGDGFPDLTEILQGSDPNDANSIPNPSPIIDLVATNGLAAGTVNVWTNTGRLTGDFVADDGGGSFSNVVGAVSDTVFGAHCLTFTGGTYVGPAATQVSGNPAFTVAAWVFNPTFQDEETVISWGGRGGPVGSMSAFGYGNDSNGWGAMTHWGADLGWDGHEIANAWTYIAYTYDPSTGLQSGYINGLLVTSNTIPALGIENLTSDSVTPYSFRVGDEMNKDGSPAGGAGFHATMSIGEIQVYTRILSPSEIYAGFTNELSQIVYGFADSDGDGMPDGYEYQYPFLNPHDPSDAAMDYDKDGLSNLEEYQHGTDPTNPDSDYDGLSDGDEVHTYGTNPANRDTDRDGLPDATEVSLGTYTLGVEDSDGDGFNDSIEVLYGSNPLDINSVPDTSTPRPLVNLDATTLPPGPLTVWTNDNALGWRFIASTNKLAVSSVDGTKGVTFDGSDYYTGPNMPPYLGVNSARTVEAWIWDPNSPSLAENFVLAWGRRGGNPAPLSNASNSALSHGNNSTYGAVQFWTGYDSPWGTNSTQINANVKVQQWTFIAYTYDPTTSNVVAYVDGVPALNATMQGPLDTVVDDPSDPLNLGPIPFGRTLPIRLAAENDTLGKPAGDNARGAFGSMTMAKVRAYNVALSAQQIADQYNAEISEFPGALKITDVKVNTANGIIVFDWTPVAGKTYAVEANNDLANPAGWTTVETNLTSGSFTNSIGGEREFFRLREE